MAGPKKVTQEEYDKIVNPLKERHSYNEMSDEKKAQFDEEIDKALVVDKKSESDDAEVAEKGEFEDGHPHGREDDEDIR